ncbi:MAG TPA: TIGR04282 family arsenosugar biosynthesis glycosyltransferase [Pirellulales bacterium]|nr:TIGR04282 family arsenosugar biosynthesis glycosyltransferase [Pirellulales bacterium]
MAREFGIFAKYWQPGQVKTRLAADIGFEPASRLHRLSLETLLCRFSGVADRRVLAFTPADRAGAFAALVESRSVPGTGHWSLEPQAAGDLGERIQHYFTSAFARGAQRVVLIGSDSPTLPDSFVAEAFDRLLTADAVIGPTADGGYYLVGLSRLLPRLFDQIAWSTPAVLAQTLGRLRAESCPYSILPSWYDVDTLADLIRLRAELAGKPTHEMLPLRQLVEEFVTIGGSPGT